MPRFRCRFFGAALLAAILSTHSTFASQTPAHSAKHSPKKSSPTSADTAASPAASSGTDSAAPAGRLDTRLKLGDGRQTWHPTRRQLGIAFAPGSSDATPGAQLHFTLDRAKARAYFNKIAPYVRRAPHNAKVVVAEHSSGDMGDAQVPAKIIPGYDGAALDTDAAVDLVQKTVQSSPSTIHIVLPLKLKPAKATTASLQGINARIGYFVTHFNPGEVGRTVTVRRAIELIDGTVVKPGQVFSVNQAVGERTAERGFGMGHVFVDGKMEKQLGGGMCQVATTLFNAAMLADLKIVERHQHVRTIPYAPPGRDATVYWGQKDFKLANNTGAPVYVSYRTTRTHAIVSLFGKATPGRKVVLMGHSRRLGERHYTGVFYRVVHEPDGTVQRDKPFYSAYKWTPALDFNH